MNQEVDCNETLLAIMNKIRPSVNRLTSYDSVENTPKKRKLSLDLSESESNTVTPRRAWNESNKIFDNDYTNSPKEIRRLKFELLAARNTILDLENRINHLHGIRKELTVQFDNENQSLKKQMEHNRKSIAELENQLQLIRKREHDLKNELNEWKNKYSNIKISTDQKIEELEKKISEISSEQCQKEGEGNSEIESLKRRIMQLENDLETAKNDTELIDKLRAELEKEKQCRSEIQIDLEMKNKELLKLHLEGKEFEYVKQNYLEYEEQAKSQATKLAKLIEIETENDKLRTENARIKSEIKNKLLLEEEVHDLKKRLIKFKEQEAKFSSVQMKLVQCEMYLNEWKAIGRGILEETTASDTALPHLLRTAVERLQQQELSLTEEKVNLKSQLNTAIHEAKVAKEELAKTLKLLNKLNSNDVDKKNLIHRMQKKLLLVTRERDSYRLQLDSYEKDLTMCFNTSALGTQASNQIQGLRERADNLEKIVSEYRDMVAKLENDLQNAQQTQSDLPPVKLEQLTRLQNEFDKLKQENDRLRERKDQLEIQLEEQCIGNDTLRGGNVYHLANNPLSECLLQREALIEKLQDERDKLKRKVKMMEEGIESSRLDITMSTKEMQILKDEIKNHEKQTGVLKEHYKATMQEFRDVVYMALGYKIDKRANSLYKFTNIYAENANDVLCFQLKEEGLNLLENDFSSRLGELIDVHLKQHNSLPNFLSMLTLDLYSNRTMMTEQIEINDN